MWGWLRRVNRRLPIWSADGSTAAPFVQVAIALGLIVLGAEIFVGAVSTLGEAAGIPPLAFSLLVAPLATELPEKFNSVLWVRRRKDTLAMGNMTGAMVFQSSFPVTIGLLFTPWELTGEALVAALVALAAGSVLYLTLRFRGRLSAPLLLAAGRVLPRVRRVRADAHLGRVRAVALGQHERVGRALREVERADQVVRLRVTLGE